MSLRTDGLASGAFAVTPSDTPTVTCFGFYVGGAGNVAFKGQDGVSSVLSAVPAGTIIPLICQILSTSTTATNITGFTP